MQSLVPAGLINGVAAKVSRINTVKLGRLVQANVGVGIVPMPSRSMMAVHHYDGGVGFLDQHISECHPHGAAADHKVVSRQSRFVFH